MSLDVRCHQCQCRGQDQVTGQIVMMERPMELLHHFPVQYGKQSFQTLEFRCGGCQGQAHVQKRPHPQNPNVLVWQQVRLNPADPREFKPNSIRPGEQVQIPVAYTLGNSPVARRRVPVGPPPTLPVAYSLDPNANPNTMISPHDPMHPANIHKRVQPWTMDQLA